MIFFKRKPRARLTLSAKSNFNFWAVWIRIPGVFGYWKFVKGSSDEACMRKLYDAVKNGKADDDRIIVEEA